MPIKAVIFDMGGVLLRTTDPAPREELAREVGLTRLELEQLIFASETAVKAETGQISEVQRWTKVLDQLKVPEEQRTEFQRRFWSKDRVDDDLIDYIRQLRTSYRTGLLSNAWDGIRPAILKRFPQMLEVFDVAMFSAEVGMRKPDRRYYYWILERLGVAADEAVFIDDFPPNVEAARQIGLKAIRFLTPEQMRQELSPLLNHHAPDSHREANG
jgi:epoxide hydrolase-like predicted phosphatase